MEKTEISGKKLNICYLSQFLAKAVSLRPPIYILGAQTNGDNIGHSKYGARGVLGGGHF